MLQFFFTMVVYVCGTFKIHLHGLQVLFHLPLDARHAQQLCGQLRHAVARFVQFALRRLPRALRRLKLRAHLLQFRRQNVEATLG